MLTLDRRQPLQGRDVRLHEVQHGAHLPRAGRRQGWLAQRSAEDLGAARFGRLEGAYFAGGAFWFDDTIGGEARLGQIFLYLPASNTLELFYEVTEPGKIESPDNIVVTPWGDLWFAEDEAVFGDS